MGSSQRGLVQVELSRTLTDFTVMTDSGDHQRFTAGLIWSGRAGFEPEIRPNGITEGQQVLSVNAADDTVTVAAHKVNIQGEEVAVAAGTQAVTRPGTDTHKISAITVTAAGLLAEVEGTEGTSFSSEFGASGGPPLIPEDSVSLGWVRMSSQTSAAITADEILQTPGQHAEYADIPGFESNNIGKGSYADVAAEKNAYVKFNSSLPLSHTGPAAKRTYIKYYTPVLSSLEYTADFKPAGMSVSKNSVSVYEGSGVDGAIGSMKADSVGDASFTLYVNDGITDPIVREENQVATVKFFPDANKVPFMLTQGMLEFSPDFPSGDPNKIDITVRCEKKSVRFSS